MKKRFAVAFSLLAILTSLISYSFVYGAPVSPGIVKIETGLVSGVKNQSDDVTAYKGIPFAAPPVGDLRWKAPQPAAKWSGVRKCETFGANPMQKSPAPFFVWSEEFLIPKEPISEDCLYLNVWTGAKTGQDKRPVLLWIYGGGFNSGGAAVPIYDGEAMAKKGVVFVSINYRVGIFGFLAHPELTKETGNKASGNYGLMDQVAALKWVQKNIAAFGGDPKNVTIAGQSAGSMSVNCLVASPLAKGLFNKAIAESGANFVGGGMPLKQAEEMGVKAVQTLNASGIAALRNMPAQELLQKAQGSFRPVIDGYVLPQTIADIFTAGKQNKVALLTGWNEDEGLVFTAPKTAEEFRQMAQRDFGPDSAAFLKYFPATDNAQAAASEVKLSRNYIFGLQNYTWANVQSKQGYPVYVYRFTRKVPATGDFVKYGAFHTAEVPYAYDNLKFLNRPLQAVDQKIADVMSAYFVNFATTGNPNGKGLPNWPAYNTSDKMIMLLGETQTAAPIPDKEALDFLYSKRSGM